MLKRAIPLFILVFLILPLANAEIIFNNEPSGNYSLGDSISISSTIKTSQDITNVFQIDLICKNQTINFYKNGVNLPAGEEKKIESSLVLSKSLIGSSKGNCFIKAHLENDYATTDNFKISDRIIIEPKKEESLFEPGQNILFEGKAKKENQEPAEGIINLEIKLENSSKTIQKTGTITSGEYSINLTFPQNMKAGKYVVKLEAKEKDSSEEVTNNGFINYFIKIKQIPTSLELVVKPEITPGETGKIKAILHDQTGENIDSQVEIEVRNNRSKIIEKRELKTNEQLEIPIKYNEPPLTWTAKAESNDLDTQRNFLIGKKSDINISLINNTVSILNTGNVAYNDSVKINIGNESIFIDVELGVDETKEYKLKAPDGEYQISIKEEDNEIKQRAVLTGRTISAKEKKTGFKLLFSLAWLFILGVLGVFTYITFKKRQNRTFLAYMPKILKKKKIEHSKRTKEKSSIKSNELRSKNPAILSLSIQGTKQKSSAVCLNIKNLKEIESTEGNAKETIQKLINYAEKQKASTHQNNDNLIFMLIPLKTKTFKNESTALEIAQTIKKTIKKHNKTFKQKIDFGVSINNGTAIIKPEKNAIKFASMGTFITQAKKMASDSESEVVYSKEIKDKIKNQVKSEKYKDREDVYHIIEIKHYNNEETKKFINNFVSNLDKKEIEESRK